MVNQLSIDRQSISPAADGKSAFVGRCVSSNADPIVSIHRTYSVDSNFELMFKPVDTIRCALGTESAGCPDLWCAFISRPDSTVSDKLINHKTDPFQLLNKLIDAQIHSKETVTVKGHPCKSVASNVAVMNDIANDV